MNNWSIEASWEALDCGAPEERAAFAAIQISANGRCHTEGHDRFAKRIRQAPYLSGYHLAEWLAWNWWRLRWEPRSRSKSWGFAHRMASIGQGYIWPNLAIFSDGEFSTLMSKSDADTNPPPYRYLSDAVSVVSAREFEREVDLFVNQVIERLHDEGVADSNLETVWQAIMEERRQPELARQRRLEALSGADPDELPPNCLQAWLDDEKLLGEAVIGEIAANHGQGGPLLSLAELRAIGASDGFAATPTQGVKQLGLSTTMTGVVRPPWQLGVEAAQALLAEQDLKSGPLPDKRLAELFGTTDKVLDSRPSQSRDMDMSFFVQDEPGYGKLILRSRWHDGRRFELARLLGDRLVFPARCALLPATRAYTYRQKVQRAFAAELLSPFQEVEAFLAGDFSEEMQQEAAQYFQVSELNIRTQLANHRHIDRDELDWEQPVDSRNTA